MIWFQVPEHDLRCILEVKPVTNTDLDSRAEELIFSVEGVAWIYSHLNVHYLVLRLMTAAPLMEQVIILKI